MTNLFKTGFYTLHSGEFSNFKIDCDALTDEDIRTIALQLFQRLPSFRTVEGVPTGGLRLAEAMARHAEPESEFLLIVDDVFTTGASMKAHRNGRAALGAVIFARAETPNWILPLFTVTS